MKSTRPAGGTSGAGVPGPKGVTPAYQRAARLSVMLVSRNRGTPTEFGQGLVSLLEPLRAIFGLQTHVRIGRRCEEDPLGRDMGEARSVPTSIEAAVEITGGEGAGEQLADRAPELGQLLQPLVEAQHCALTIGPAYRIVEPKPGGVFMSLSFNRHADTTIEQFRHWWLTQHSKLVVSLMPGFTAYDQVHVDHELSRRAAEAAGLPHVPYDAYDNLTWESLSTFTRSTSADPQAMRTIYEDEVGRIDHSSYRGALMDTLC